MGLYADATGFSVHADEYAAAEGADAIVLVTEWKQYWVPDFEKLSAIMRGKVIVDGRNIWPQEAAMSHGFTCHAIGRQSAS